MANIGLLYIRVDWLLAHWLKYYCPQGKSSPMLMPVTEPFIMIYNSQATLKRIWQQGRVY